MALMPMPLFGRSSLLRSFFDDPFMGPTADFPLLEDTPTLQLARTASAAANTQIDWVETPEAHIIKADMPGLKKEDIKVTLEDDRTLQISGERVKDEVKKTDTWHRVERARTSFMRRMRLPENADVEKLKAQVQDGVLTVTVPKKHEMKPETRSIEIQG